MLCVVDIGLEGLDKAEIEEFYREQLTVLCHKYSLISIFCLFDKLYTVQFTIVTYYIMRIVSWLIIAVTYICSERSYVIMLSYL